MLDDLGTKVLMDKLDGFELSWLIETSPGNHQGGIILVEPLDGDPAERLLKAVMDSGLCDEGAGGAQTGWARLPVAINKKPKYVDEAGVFGEDGELKQTLFTRRTPGKEIEYF